MGNYTGAIIAKEDNLVKNYSWLGYAGQAGIALGLGIIIERTFPGEIGKIFLTIMPTNCDCNIDSAFGDIIIVFYRNYDTISTSIV